MPRSALPPLPAAISAHRFAFLEGAAVQWVRNPDELFTGGYCAACGAPQGARTEVRLRAVYRDGRDRHSHGASAIREQDSPVRPTLAPRLTLFSEPFLEGIGPEARDAFTWRPVDVIGPAVHPMFELAGARTHVPFTALPGARWLPHQCAACGQQEPPWYALQEFMPEWLVQRGFPSLRLRPSAFIVPEQQQEEDPPWSFPTWFSAGLWYVRHGLAVGEDHWLGRLMRKKFAGGVAYQTIERLARPASRPAEPMVAT